MAEIFVPKIIKIKIIKIGKHFSVTIENVRDVFFPDTVYYNTQQAKPNGWIYKHSIYIAC